MDVTVEVKGLAEFEARLVEIENLGGQKLLRRVFRRIAKPLLQRAQANASTVSASGSSGALARSLKIVTRREKPRQVARVAVTSKGKDRTAVYLHNAFYDRKRKGIFYGWMVDQGHRISSGGRLRRVSRALTEKGLARYAKRLAGGRIRGSEATGRVQARPWWTPAVQASEPAMVSGMVREMAAALQRIEKRKSKTASPDSVVPV